MPAHGTGGCGFQSVFLDGLISRKTHHHVVVIIESRIQFGAGRGFPPFYGAWAVVTAPGLFHAVGMTTCLAAVAS